MRPSPRVQNVGLSRWPRELQILLCCGQTQASAQNDVRTDEILVAGLDWQRVLGSGALLGMLSLLHSHLATRKAAVPAPVWDLLRQHSRLQHARNLQAVGEMYALLDRFTAQGIRVMPFKGPVLAMQAYGTLSLRPFADLDLLVRPADAAAACHLLADLEYISRYTMSDGQRANLLRFGCEHPFQRTHLVDRPADGEARNHAEITRRDDVDLHWNLFPPSFPIAFDQDTLWQRAETVKVGNREIVTIGTEVLIIYLCAHGYAHHWNRLEWICALARLIATHPQVNWEWVQQEAQRMDAQRVLELGLVLAGDWLGAPVPAHLLTEARNRSTISTLIDHVAVRLMRDPTKTVAPESTLNEELFFDLDASENWRRRISYFLRRLLTPSLEDVEWVSLPAHLPALYYFLRPVRLSLRYLGSTSYSSAK